MVANMAGVSQLQKQFVDYKASLFQEVSENYTHIYVRYTKVVVRVCFGLDGDEYLLFCMKGVLDEQFDQLQGLQDESNPNFVVEVVSLFFQDSERLLNDLTKTL